jgi:hypothetical protein
VTLVEIFGHRDAWSLKVLPPPALATLGQTLPVKANGAQQ